MAEIRHLIEDKKLEFRGLCNIRGLYAMITDWLQERGYLKNESKNFEEVREGSKAMDLLLEPTRKISDYIQLGLKIEIECDDVKDVNIEVDGRKETVQEATMRFSFDAKLLTDYENKWETKPFYFFLRTLMDKYVFKGIIHKYEEMVMKDMKDLESEIKAYLNIVKHKV